MFNQTFEIKLWMMLLSLIISMATSSVVTYIASRPDTKPNQVSSSITHYCPACPVCSSPKPHKPDDFWNFKPLPTKGGKIY